MTQPQFTLPHLPTKQLECKPARQRVRTHQVCGTGYNANQAAEVWKEHGDEPAVGDHKQAGA